MVCYLNLKQEEPGCSEPQPGRLAPAGSALDGACAFEQTLAALLAGNAGWHSDEQYRTSQAALHAIYLGLSAGQWPAVRAMRVDQ